MPEFIAAASAWLSDYYLLATVLMIVVLMATKILAQPARRMAIHWSAAGGLLLLAMLCAIPGWSVIHMLSATESEFVEVPIAPIDPQMQSLLLPSDPPRMLQQEPNDARIAEAPIPQTIEQPTWSLNLRELACALFAVGASISLVWLAIGRWQMRRLRSRAEPAPPEVDSLLQSLAHQANEKMPTLGVVPNLPVAAAVGLRRPMVLLPSDFVETAGPHDLRSVLAHELAHVRNRDLWLLALVRGLLPLFWCHPCYWLWRRGLRLDQEMLADAAASDLTSQHDYADQLVTWARIASESRTPRLASSVGLWESPSQLKRRITLLLDEQLTVLRKCSRKWRVGSIVTLLLVAVGLSLCTLQPKSAAEATRSVAQDSKAHDSKAQGNEEPSNEEMGSEELPWKKKVEIVAIGTHDEDPQQWWDHVGKLIEDFEMDWQAGTASVSGPHASWRRVIVHVPGLPAGARVKWHIDGATASAGARVGGRNYGGDGYYSRYFNIAEQKAQFGVRVGVAAGDWKTVAQGTQGSATGTSTGHNVIFSIVEPNGTGSRVTYTHNVIEQDYRIVAIDKQGKRHPQIGYGGVSAGTLVQSKTRIPLVQPEDIGLFEFQVRDYEWMEFKKLPTSPGDKRGTPERGHSEKSTEQRLQSNTQTPSFLSFPAGKARLVDESTAASSAWPMPLNSDSSVPATMRPKHDKLDSAISNESLLEMSDDRLVLISESQLKAEPVDSITEASPWLVQGRVVDEAGNGLAGVEIRVATGVGSLLGGGITTTDSSGRYKLRFSPGMRMKVSASAPMGVGVQAASIYASKRGWSEQNLCRHGDLLMSDLTPETLGSGAEPWGKTSDDVVFARQPKTIDFVMKPAVQLEVQFVESSRNWAVSGQTISIIGPELPPSSSVLASAKTDRTGKFQYESLPTHKDWRLAMRVANTAIDLESDTFQFKTPGRYQCRLVLQADQPDSATASLKLLVRDFVRKGP